MYKEAKLLRAAVNSSEKVRLFAHGEDDVDSTSEKCPYSQIDKAFENVIDCIFYTIALCIILNQLGKFVQ